MDQSLTINKASLKTKTLITAAAIIAAVALPQFFHAVGAISGLGAAVGETFLPMQLPVLLAGLLAGPAVGLLAGALSPLVSFALSGMPGPAMLPFIIIELAGYGLACGLLRKVKMPVFCKLLLAQVAGRALRAGAILVAAYGFGSKTIDIATMWSFVIIGLPGILLQWCLLPLLLYRIESIKK